MLPNRACTAKAKTLKVLEESRGRVVSGEKLAESASVSRAAIWKAVESLRKEGYPIKASTNRGYVLEESSDFLSAQAMLQHLDENIYPYGEKYIYTYKTLESTNKTAKQKSFEGVPNGTVILAEGQTHGRGRLGRNFFSPVGKGLYMSFIIRPEFDSSKSLLVTTAASVAVCRAIKKVCGLETQIKWVNDIFFEGRKICGILTEAISNFESGQIDAVIIGIGINCRISQEDMPEEIRETAGSLAGNIPRNRLAAEIVNEIMGIMRDFNEEGLYPEHIDEYRRRSMVLRKNVRVYRNIKSDEYLNATAIDISDEGGLIVIYSDGRKDTLTTGEISIRLK
ncbi:MAG: biotin--[acetyl-CoA-carboxylase] ligase [Clostridiales bacterium]|nr:biotin--[acetyl-CoA-carboxylase] ligase [Clostridiales bacterium]